jgi:peptide subunit release factor 1 (eRF1)
MTAPMAATVTSDLVRQLAAFRASNGCALSVYVGFDPSSTPTAPDVEAKFSAVLSGAEKEAEAHAQGRGHDCRGAVRADLEQIRSWWDGEFDRDGAHGVAIFVSSADGLFRTVPLPAAVGDLVRIGSSLHLGPIAGRLGRDDGLLVAVVSRERGTVYRLVRGRLHEVVDESDEVPGQHTQGGWAQARYGRHIEQLVKQHLKTIGDEVDRRVHIERHLRIVLVCSEDLRGEFEAALSTEARAALVGWRTADAHAGPDELLKLVQPLLDEAAAHDEREVLERWQEEHGRGGRSAAGWKQVLDAASDARVETLLLEEGPPRQAWQCPQCGRVSADGGKCPLDDARLEEHPDAADLAIQQTVLHGGTLVWLGAGALGEAAGIAALLRF